MEFGEIVVKDTPGLCRCCLSEGCYKDLGTEYPWMEETEVYADMLLECFDVSISQHNEGPNGPNRLICEVCITRLRDACNFKKQVLDSEKKFIDMVGRGAFKTKVLLYPEQMKSESEEVATDEAEIEYLEEEVDYDDIPLNELAEPSVSEDITVATLPVAKRGRPRKTVKTEKKKKIEEKTKTKNKGMRIKSEYQTYLERLSTIRGNILTLLRYGKVIPFHWNYRGFKCFYCAKQMKDCDTLKEHTKVSHQDVDLDVFIPRRVISKDVPVKIDITDMTCKFCDVPLSSIDDLIAHIVTLHDQEYDNSIGVCVFPFNLNKDYLQCVLCPERYDSFTTILGHMNKNHSTRSFICQICGLAFIDPMRLKRHIRNSHVGYRCSICDKMFEAFCELEKHKQRIHGIHRRIECNRCNATFQNLYQVKVHLGNVHNVDKYRIKCEHCPKICTTKGALALHVQSVHSDARFECDLCDYRSGVKWMIKLHKRKHFGEKNYMCTICDKRFGRSSNLRAHMKVHTGRPGRVCRLCRHGFVDLNSRNEHDKEVHYYSQ